MQEVLNDSNINDRLTDPIQCFYDFCVVRAPQTHELQASYDCNTHKLGGRVFRVLLSGAG